MARAPAAEPLRSQTLFVTEVVDRYYHPAKTYYTKDGLPTGEHITFKCAVRPLKNNFGTQYAHELGPRKLKNLQEVMIELDFRQ
jgi:hypothetical protein